jgi:hypothetical protein
VKGSRRLDRGYAALNSSERARLAVAALARCDEREHDRLESTCPRRHYLGFERGYVTVVQLASEFTTAFAAIEVAPRAAKLELLERIRVIATELLAPAGSDTPDHVDESTPDGSTLFFKVLAETERRLALEAAAVAHGFAAFSVDVFGIEASELLAAFARPFDTQFDRLAATEADPELVEAARGEWTQAWRDRLRAS